MDTVNEGYKSIFDPELEEILRETEGYELTPQNEDGEPEYDESELPDEQGSRAEEIIREQAERREHKRKKKLIIICAAIVAALAAMLALILLLKQGALKRTMIKPSAGRRSITTQEITTMPSASFARSWR